MAKVIRRFKRHFRYGEKGFTLIELLVVVAILGILAAIAVPNVGRFIDRGQEQAKETELHNVQTSVMALMVESVDGTMTAVGGFPITTGDLSEVSCVTANATTVLLSDLVTGLDGTSTKLQVEYTIYEDGTVEQDDL